MELHHSGATDIAHHEIATGCMGSHTQPPPRKHPGIFQAGLPSDILTSLPQNASTTPNKETGEIRQFFELRSGEAMVTFAKPACCEKRGPDNAIWDAAWKRPSPQGPCLLSWNCRRPPWVATRPGQIGIAVREGRDLWPPSRWSLPPVGPCASRRRA